MLNLRPAEVQADGSAVDRAGDAIDLASSSGTGFALSVPDFAGLSGASIVVGSAAHSGAINVNGALTVTDPLTLQNSGASSGGIAINAPLQAPQLGLVSAGDVAQNQAGVITANDVLARSSGGNVNLATAQNNAGTLGGSAAGRFAWLDSDALQLAPVSVTGASASVNVPQTLTASALGGQNVLVRTLTNDLTVAMPVSSTAGADLVAANRFQNPGTGSISGPGQWRVWADTWVGESRGGVFGSAPRPNFYGCTYGSSCPLSIPLADNHFIYTQRPNATVQINNASRYVGQPNPPFTFTVSGWVHPDDNVASIQGSATTSANPSSPPGQYPITGSYTSDIWSFRQRANPIAAVSVQLPTVHGAR